MSEIAPEEERKVIMTDYEETDLNDSFDSQYCLKPTGKIEQLNAPPVPSCNSTDIKKIMML